MDEKPKITHSVNKEFQKAAGQYESNVPNKELVESSEKEETMENSVDAAASESLFSKIKAFLTSMAGAVIKKLSESKNEPKQTIDGDNGTNINDDISDNNNKVNRSKNSVNSEGDNAKIGDNNIDGDNNHVDNSKGSINIKSIGQGITTIINQSRITIAAFAGMVLIVVLFQLPDIINSYIKPNTNEKQPFIVQTTISTSFTPPLTTTEPSENTTFLTTTTTPDLTTVLPETTQTTTTTPVATTTSRPVQAQRTSIQQPPETEPTEPPTPERTEPPETTTVTQTEPPTDPPTDPPIIEGVDANGLAYKIENGTATITGYQGTATEVIIPKYVVGVPVYAIGERAFANNETIQKVVIEGNWSRDFAGNTIEHTGTRVIGKWAFLDCLNLMKVELPSSITSIGDEAFAKSTPDIHIKICYMDLGNRWDEISKNNAGLDAEYITVETYPYS